jgi:hypothetical protein
MSRVFWVAVGAVGGIVAYRKGTQAAARAKELGPLGTAQVAAQATSRLAGRTAHGLGRLNDIKARREGRRGGRPGGACGRGSGCPCPASRSAHPTPRGPWGPAG